MKTAVVIHEENHGFIGIAKDIESAFHFLIKEDWIDDLWDNINQIYVHPKKLYHRYNVNNLFDLLKAMYRADDNAFDGLFYFNTQIIYEREEKE